MVTSSYLRDEKGAAKFGTCSSCGKDSSEDYNMIRLSFTDADTRLLSVCLCRTCRKKLSSYLNAASAFDDFMR